MGPKAFGPMEAPFIERFQRFGPSASKDSGPMGQKRSLTGFGRTHAINRSLSRCSFGCALSPFTSGASSTSAPVTPYCHWLPTQNSVPAPADRGAQQICIFARHLFPGSPQVPPIPVLLRDCALSISLDSDIHGPEASPRNDYLPSGATFPHRGVAKQALIQRIKHHTASSIVIALFPILARPVSLPLASIICCYAQTITNRNT